MSQPRSLVAPDGYADRIRLCLDALPGKQGERAALIGATAQQFSRWYSGARVPEDPKPIADAVGVEVGLVYAGPTARLRAVLAGR